jgi:predicted TIM-barrel fold metal-dependent hydrolase
MTDAFPRYKVFDVELHAFPSLEGFRRMAAFSFGAFARIAHAPIPDVSRHMQMTIDYMDANNVICGVVSGDNLTVQEWRRAHPSRFLASFCPDLALQDQAAAAEAFDREVEAGLWHGLGELLLPYRGIPLNDPRLDPLLAVCQRRRLPVAYHTGLNGPRPRSTFRVELGDPLLLQDVLDRFPELNIIILHLGWPFFDHALYLLYAYPTVHAAVGVVNWILGPATFQRMLREAVDCLGSDRILFSSDQMGWPQMITPAVKAITSADFLSEADKTNILWNNAARLYPLPAGTQSA